MEIDYREYLLDTLECFIRDHSKEPGSFCGIDYDTELYYFLDSLPTIEIVVKIEKEFDLTLNSETDWSHFETINKLNVFLVEKQKEGGD